MKPIHCFPFLVLFALCWVSLGTTQEIHPEGLSAFINQQGYFVRTLSSESLQMMKNALDMVNKALREAGEAYQLELCEKEQLSRRRAPSVIPVVVLGPTNVPKGADLFTFGVPKAIFVQWPQFEAIYSSEIRYLKDNRKPALDQLGALIRQIQQQNEGPDLGITADMIKRLQKELAEWREIVPSKESFLFVSLLHELGHVHWGDRGKAGLLLHAPDLAFQRGLTNAERRDRKRVESRADSYAMKVIGLAANSDDVNFGDRVATAMNSIYLIGRVEAFRIAKHHQAGNALALFDTDYQHECRTLRLLKMHKAFLESIVNFAKQHREVSGEDLGVKQQIVALNQAISLIESIREAYDNQQEKKARAAVD